MKPAFARCTDRTRSRAPPTPGPTLPTTAPATWTPFRAWRPSCFFLVGCRAHFSCKAASAEASPLPFSAPAWHSAKPLLPNRADLCTPSPGRVLGSTDLCQSHAVLPVSEGLRQCFQWEGARQPIAVLLPRHPTTLLTSLGCPGISSIPAWSPERRSCCVPPTASSRLIRPHMLSPECCPSSGRRCPGLDDTRPPRLATDQSPVFESVPVNILLSGRAALLLLSSSNI